MKKIFYSFVLLISSYTFCFGKASEITGEGAVLCYEFISPSNKGNNKTREEFFMAWASGYMSSKNVMSGKKVDLLSIDLDEQLAILKIYCEENKKSYFGIAVEYLYNELQQRSNTEK